MHVRYRIPAGRLERVRDRLEQVGPQEAQHGRQITVEDDPSGPVLSIQIEGELADVQEQIDFAAALFGLDHDDLIV